MFSGTMTNRMKLLGDTIRYRTAKLAVSKEQHPSCPRGFILLGRFSFYKRRAEL